MFSLKIKHVLLVSLGMVFFLTGLIAFSGCHRSERVSEAPRVVALTPSLASAVLSVDARVELVGASQYSEWPERAARVAFLPTPAPIEQVVSLKPDLVLVHPSDVQLIHKLEQLHLNYVAHGMDTLADIESTYLSLGTALGEPALGQSAVDALRRALNDAVPAEQTGVDLLVVIDVLDARMQQLYLAQNAAFLASLLERCGAHVIAVDEDNWTRISAESLFRLDPSAILFLSPDAVTGEQRRELFSKIYRDLSAVQQNRVVYLNEASISQPDDRLPNTQKRLCDAIRSLK